MVLVVAIATVGVAAQPAQAAVALMAGQRARALNGNFNSVPVLHSNQPEEVEGPGILITTEPGVTYAAENGAALKNAEFTFNGDFGVHMHHKYFPDYRKQIRPGERRTELTLGLILINPGQRPIQISFDRGAVRNSFEAPYLANNLMGVKPLGVRPWNTGPGDATAVQMLRGSLDRGLSETITIPARSRVVLFRTQLPALGIANALLRGRSNGPFQMAVVAASNPYSDADLVRVLDQRRLAPGRVYLNQLAAIKNRRVFSRVGGVALGDEYQASITHDLKRQGPLHVPLTSTDRHHFGTRDVQVNQLASRMIDSSLDNVGTYGVRFDVDLNLKGSGSYELVMSHPTIPGVNTFTAFRGSIQIRTPEGLQEVHVGMRSGESLSLATLNLPGGGSSYPVRVSLVYPADATPGHLLSVVPISQLAMVQARQQAQAASSPATPAPRPVAPAPRQPAPAPRAAAPPRAVNPAPARVMPAPQAARPGPAVTRPPALPRGQAATTVNPDLLDRYQEALDAQRRIMRELMQR
ncbi:DUF3370 family protein [Cyanobium sp. LEGE 06113]|uniref:DUF3370 family protein n=1 Tax=Cyanobium sp. LEGE 06113 TaxID=1297573 RepID=UPI0018817385|nr:DUF3370 family protein [Cyanobium sp. LEGE 06113]MBE9153491.1 DUF3370 family protein [Cyanobium sp. LEGE 06113]